MIYNELTNDPALTIAKELGLEVENTQRLIVRALKIWVLLKDPSKQTDDEKLVSQVAAGLRFHDYVIQSIVAKYGLNEVVPPFFILDLQSDEKTRGLRKEAMDLGFTLEETAKMFNAAVGKALKGRPGTLFK